MFLSWKIFVKYFHSLRHDWFCCFYSSYGSLELYLNPYSHSPQLPCLPSLSSLEKNIGFLTIIELLTDVGLKKTFWTSNRFWIHASWNEFMILESFVLDPEKRRVKKSDPSPDEPIDHSLNE